MIIEKLTNNNIVLKRPNGTTIGTFQPTCSVRLDPYSKTNLLIYPVTGTAAPINIFVPTFKKLVNLVTPAADTTAYYTREELYNILMQNFFYIP